MSDSSAQPTPDAASAAIATRISNHVVSTMNNYTGRGATTAWTSLGDDLISVVLRDILTRGERSLVADGRSQLVLDTRKAYQDTMRQDLVAGIERISGRRVIAFLSDNHLDPDIAVECFVLEPHQATAPDPGGDASRT